jgi:hypothetical protein
MAKKSLTQSFVILLGTVTFIVTNASSSGRGSEDRTGAPGSSGTCASCHGGNSNLNGQLAIELLDKSTSTKVTEYIPGNQYIVSIKASGTSTRMGFQSTILNSSNANIGSISNASAGAAVYTSSRNIAGHTSGSSTGNWTYEWTAPTMDQGVATIYGVSVISNKNNSDNGDQVVTNKITINPAASNNLKHINTQQLIGYPNPCSDILHFSKMADAVIVFDISGSKVLEYSIPVNSINVSTLKSGFYYVQTIENNISTTLRILVSK